MDFIRTAYVTKFRPWKNDATEIDVRWFRCPAGAASVPMPTIYSSWEWDDRKSMRYVVGDKFPHDYQWSDGSNERGYSGIKPCGPVDAWRGGGVHGRDTPIVTDAQGVSTCCAMVGLLAEGGFGLGGSAVWPAIPPFSAWTGGKGLGDHWIYAPQPYAAWSGGKGLGGAFEYAAGPWERMEGGKGLGGAFEYAAGPWERMEGGKGLGGAFTSVVGPIALFTGGKGIGEKWVDIATPWEGFAGGKGIGDSWPASSGPTSAWSGGKGLGGSWPASSGPWFLWEGGKGLGGTFLDSFYAEVGMAFIPGGAGYATVGAAPTVSTDTNQWLNGYWIQSGAANGDTREWKFMAPAGTYLLTLFHIVGTNAGKIDVYVDNVLQWSAFDMYNAAFLVNRRQSQNITVVGNGWHTLKTVVNGKNASSSGYIFYCSAWWFY